MSNELIEDLSPDGVLRITMNRPEIHNAFDDVQVIRITKALESAAINENVRIIVLGGEGKSFSAGGDLNYMRRMGDNTYDENLVDVDPHQGRRGLVPKGS